MSSSLSAARFLSCGFHRNLPLKIARALDRAIFPQTVRERKKG